MTRYNHDDIVAQHAADQENARVRDERAEADDGMTASERAMAESEDLLSDILDEDLTLMLVPLENGRHPEYPHLVHIEAEAHGGGWLVTSPARPGCTALVSEDDLDAMLMGQRTHGDTCESGYVSDEYLDLLLPSSDSQTLPPYPDVTFIDIKGGEYPHRSPEGMDRASCFQAQNPEFLEVVGVLPHCYGFAPRDAAAATALIQWLEAWRARHLD